MVPFIFLRTPQIPISSGDRTQKCEQVWQRTTRLGKFSLKRVDFMAVVVFYAYFCYHATMKSQVKRRVFLALNPPVSVKNAILKHFSSIPTLPFSWRLVPAENFHITLIFLGSVSVWQLSNLSKSLLNIFAKTPKFRVHLGDIKFFPESPARVVYREVLPNRELLELQSRLKKHCQNKGFLIPNSKYQPHLTLGHQQVKSWDEQTASSSLHDKSFFRQPSISWQVTTAEMMESHLTNSGSRYSCRYQYKFF